MQVLEAPEFTVLRLQLNDVKLSGEVVVTVPPVAVVEMPLPADEAAIAFVTAIEVAVVAGESVTLITATTPFWIVFMFNPVNRHVKDPGLTPHDMDLPAAVADAPALAVIATISEGE